MTHELKQSPYSHELLHATSDLSAVVLSYYLTHHSICSESFLPDGVNVRANPHGSYFSPLTSIPELMKDNIRKSFADLARNPELRKLNNRIFAAYDAGGAFHSYQDKPGTMQVHSLLQGGLHTGVVISMQMTILEALYGSENLKANPDIRTLAKTFLWDIDMTQQGIGLNTRWQIERERKFDLISPGEPVIGASVGLDKDGLRKRGWGESYGCPALRKPSEFVIGFARDHFGLVIPAESPIDTLSAHIRAVMQTVFDWGNQAGAENLKRIVDPYDLELFQGTHPNLPNPELITPIWPR